MSKGSVEGLCIPRLTLRRHDAIADTEYYCRLRYSPTPNYFYRALEPSCSLLGFQQLCLFVAVGIRTAVFHADDTSPPLLDRSLLRQEDFWFLPTLLQGSDDGDCGVGRVTEKEAARKKVVQSVGGRSAMVRWDRVQMLKYSGTQQRRRGRTKGKCEERGEHISIHDLPNKVQQALL